LFLRVWESGGREKLFFTRKKVFLFPPSPPTLFKKSGVFVDGMLCRRAVLGCGVLFFCRVFVDGMLCRRAILGCGVSFLCRVFVCDSVLKVKPFFELFLKIIPDCISDQPLS